MVLVCSIPKDRAGQAVGSSRTVATGHAGAISRPLAATSYGKRTAAGYRWRRLVSAPISTFDRRLISYATNDWQRQPQLVGMALASQMDDDLIQAGDIFLAARIDAIVESGGLEIQGKSALELHKSGETAATGLRGDQREDVMKFEGGCYCDAVRYVAEGEPMCKAQCHCRECSTSPAVSQYVRGDAARRLQIHQGCAQAVFAQGSGEAGDARVLRRMRHTHGDAAAAAARRGEGWNARRSRRDHAADRRSTRSTSSRSTTFPRACRVSSGCRSGRSCGKTSPADDNDRHCEKPKRRSNPSRRAVP